MCLGNESTSRKGCEEMNQNERLDRRIQNLENLVENLREETLEVKTTLSSLKSVIEDLSRRLPLTMNPKGHVNDQSKVNPWTRDGQSDVMKALASLRQRPSVEFSKETFGPTIKALKSKEEGMTASQVGEITGRKRNTESFYLKRLYDIPMKRGTKIQKRSHRNGPAA